MDLTNVTMISVLEAYKKMDINNTAVKRCKAIASANLILGILFIVIFGLTGFGTGNIPWGVSQTAFGIVLIAYFVQLNNLIKLFKSYSERLASDPSKSIETLASAQNISVDIVKRKLQRMINRHFFENAYIDQQRNRLVIFNEMGPILTNLDTKAEAELLCTKCGVILPVHAKFCTKCGAPTEQKCPKCGAALSDSPNFCPNCGEKL